MAVILEILRYTVFGAVAVVGLGAAGALAVQRRLINPFGKPARRIRDLTDPALKPIERRLLRGGGNPQHAPWWLLVLGIVGGIVVLSVLEWGIATVYEFLHAASRGGRSVLWLLVDWTFGILMIALMVRVIGSWFGLDRWNRWMRPFHVLTEWFLRPLRQIIPPLGPLDISPLVAWFALYILRGLALGIL